MPRIALFTTAKTTGSQATNQPTLNARLKWGYAAARPDGGVHLYVLSMSKRDIFPAHLWYIGTYFMLVTFLAYIEEEMFTNKCFAYEQDGAFTMTPGSPGSSNWPG